MMHARTLPLSLSALSLVRLSSSSAIWCATASACVARSTATSSATDAVNALYSLRMAPYTHRIKTRSHALLAELAQSMLWQCQG